MLTVQLEKEFSDLGEAIMRSVRIVEMQSVATWESPWHLALYLQGSCCPMGDQLMMIFKLHFAEVRKRL